VPHRKGHLGQGGRLYMLAVRGRANLDLGKFYPIGTRWRVRWVPVEDPLAITQSCYDQGAALGGARFSRLEGAWWGVHTGCFLSTNGGSAGEGQVFEYDPRSESLTVIYDAPKANTTPTTSPSRRADRCCCVRMRPATSSPKANGWWG
jgi:hypothetical protein